MICIYLDVLAAPDLPLLYECPSAGVGKTCILAHTDIIRTYTHVRSCTYACMYVCMQSCEINNTHSMFAVPEGCSVSLCIHSGPRGHYSNLQSFLPFALANPSSVYE